MNLAMNVKKCKFSVKRLKYLDYVLEPAALQIDSDKVEAIIKYPALKSVKEKRRFMGMAGWYHRFVKDYTKLVTSLTDLTKKTAGKFVWITQDMIFHLQCMIHQKLAYLLRNLTKLNMNIS